MPVSFLFEELELIWKVLAKENLYKIKRLVEDKFSVFYAQLPAFKHDIAILDECMDEDRHGFILFKLEHDLAHLRILVNLLPETIQKRVRVL